MVVYMALTPTNHSGTTNLCGADRKIVQHPQIATEWILNPLLSSIYYYEADESCCDMKHFTVLL